MSQDFFEIQILEDTEKLAIKGFYAALASKDPKTIEDTFKACLRRYERTIKGYFILQEAFINFNGYAHADDYTVILHPGGHAEILSLVGDDELAEIDGMP